MIDPELVAKIRLLFFAEHWKIGTIATQLNLHRDTVRAALETDRFNRPKQERTSCKTDPYVDFIRQTPGAVSPPALHSDFSDDSRPWL